MCLIHGLVDVELVGVRIFEKISVPFPYIAEGEGPIRKEFPLEGYGELIRVRRLESLVAVARLA